MRLISRNWPQRLTLTRGVVVAPDRQTVIDRHGQVLHLNTTAAVMLDVLLAEGLDAAVPTLRQRFAVAEDVVRTDLAGLLVQLLDRKLVRWR